MIETDQKICRDVTAREVAQYAAQGWAKLPGFIEPDFVGRLLAMAKARMGEDGQGNAVAPMTQPFFNPEMTDGAGDPLLRPLFEAVGRNAKLLMQRRPEVGVRYFGDLFAPKLPASRETRHPGAGATYFHQDFINWGLDRSGGITFWIALTELGGESGTMQFFTGSHREGTLGNYRTYQNILDIYPELGTRCELSEPMTYSVGDVTVHNNLTVHGAGENLTDQPRWAYLVIVNPSDARWTGAVPEAYDTSGMTLFQELDDERFPVIG